MSSRNAPWGAERCVTTQKTAVQQTSPMTHMTQKGKEEEDNRRCCRSLHISGRDSRFPPFGAERGALDSGFAILSLCGKRSGVVEKEDQGLVKLTVLTVSSTHSYLNLLLLLQYSVK